MPNCAAQKEKTPPIHICLLLKKILAASVLNWQKLIVMVITKIGCIQIVLNYAIQTSPAQRNLFLKQWRSVLAKKILATSVLKCQKPIVMVIVHKGKRQVLEKGRRTMRGAGATLLNGATPKTSG